RARRATGEAGEPVDDPRVLPSALPLDPERVREVVERRQRLHTVLADRVQDGAVVVRFALVERALLGLETRPLDREAVRVVAEIAREREVLAEAPVVV